MLILCNQCGKIMTVGGETIYEHWMSHHSIELLTKEGVTSENSSISN